MDTPNLCKMENDNHFPQTKNIERLAKILNVELKELFDFETPPKKENIKNKIISHIDKLDESQLKFIYKIITSFCDYIN